MNRIEIKRKQIQALTRLIWVATWLVMGRLIGNNGIAYLAVAMETMTFFLSLLADRLPDALGRILRSRYTKEQYKNADTVRHSVLIWQSVVAVLAGIIVFFFADFFADKVFLLPFSALAMKILAPAVVFRVLSGVFLGYFQGKGAQMPTILASTVRQVLYLGLGILFVNKLKTYGEKVELLLLNEALPSMYGASGMALAVVITELLILLLVVILYLGNRKMSVGQGMKKTETFIGAISGLFGSMATFSSIDVLVRMPIWLGLLFYMRVAQEGTAAGLYGRYYGGYLMICAIPVIILSCLFHPICAKVAAAVKKGESKLSREMSGAAMHGGFTYSLIIGVTLAVLSEQVSKVLVVSEALDDVITNTVTDVAEMIRCGSAMIVFATMSIIFIRILMYVGKISKVLCSLMGYVIAYIVATQLCLRVWKLDILGLVYGGIIALVLLCLVAGVIVVKLNRIRMDWLYWFVMPLGASTLSGLICYGLQRIMTPHLGEFVTLVVSLIISLVIYWVVLVLLHNFRKKELEWLPGIKLLFR